jgi:hypothetical protein
MTPSQSLASLAAPAQAPLAPSAAHGMSVPGDCGAAGCGALNRASDQTTRASDQTSRASDQTDRDFDQTDRDFDQTDRDFDQTDRAQAAGSACGAVGLANGPAGWVPSRARPSAKAPLAPSRRAAEAYQARIHAGVARAEAARAASDRAGRLISMMTGVVASSPVAAAEEASALVAGVQDSESRRAADAASAAMRAELARNSGPRRARVSAPGGVPRASAAVELVPHPRVPSAASGSAVARLAAGRMEGLARPGDQAPVLVAPVDPRCLDVIRRKPSNPRLLG